MPNVVLRIFQMGFKRSSKHPNEVGIRTEELLASARLLNNLNKTRLQLLDRRNVVGKDTHLARLGGEVDLDTEQG